MAQGRPCAAAHTEGRQLFWPAAEKAGWDVTHREIPGYGHVWELWDREIRAFIEWAYPKESEE